MVELSSLDVRALAQELRRLEDAFVDKATQTGPTELIVKLRVPQRGATHLVLRPPEFAATTDSPPPAPEKPTTFAMTLRKHLANARLRRVDQHEFDRVLRFQFERGGEPHELVLELFGKGNLVLAGPDGKILLALRTEAFAHRSIKRGEILVFPPPRANPVTMPKTELETRAAASEKDVVRFLALDLGLGGDLAEEVVFGAGLDKTLKARSLGPGDVDRLWSSLRSMLDAAPSPAVVTTPKGPQVSSHAFQAPVFRAAPREPTPSVNDAIWRVVEAERSSAEPEPDAEKARLERQVEHQRRAIDDMGKEADAWEKQGHLVFAHYDTVSLVLQKAKANVQAHGWADLAQRFRDRGASDEPWLGRLSSVDAKRARVEVNLDGENVPLDPLRNLEANATLLYDESKRLRAKQANARTALEDTQRKLALQAKAAKPKPAAGPKAPAKRFWFESNRWFYSSEGFLVVAGRDAGSNERLVKRHLATGDRYVHADFQGAPSCVVKAEGRVPGAATLREACQFGVTNSRAFNQFGSADAYWVHPEQVSKQGDTGQYVPRGSFVIRGSRNYETKLPLEASLGLVGLDKQGRPAADGALSRLMAGPSSAIEVHARQRVKVVRGDAKPSDAARRLAPLFGVSLDEVIAALPPGNVRIVEGSEASP